jgi:phage terminase large subunit GpA-like protein
MLLGDETEAEELERHEPSAPRTLCAPSSRPWSPASRRCARSPPMRLSEWAAKHFKLSGRGEPRVGAVARVPVPDRLDGRVQQRRHRRGDRPQGQARRLHEDAARLHRLQRAHRRRKQALWQPTDDDRDSFVKTEVEPMLRDVEAMRPVLVPGKEDTIKLKTFLGSVLHLLGGKAARAYRRITVAVVMVDEATRSTRKSRRPSTRWRLRRGASRARRSRSSSPDRRCASTASATSSTAKTRPRRVMRYRIVCPHCGEHPLLWGGKKVRTASSGTAATRRPCATCARTAARRITQADYLQIWDRARPGCRSAAGGGTTTTPACGSTRTARVRRRGTWRSWMSGPPTARSASGWTSCASSSRPRRRPTAGETGPLETFINETLAQYWKVEMDQADEHALAKRAEGYKLRTVPQGGVVLVAGVDVQDNRWEVVVWAIGRGEEMWAVDYRSSTATRRTSASGRRSSTPYLFEATFEHASGQMLKIEAAAVDTQGHFTHQAYNFCRTRERRNACSRCAVIRSRPRWSRARPPSRTSTGAARCSSAACACGTSAPTRPRT